MVLVSHRTQVLSPAGERLPGRRGGPGFALLLQGTEKAAGKTGERPVTASDGSRVWGVEVEPEGGATAEGAPGSRQTHLPTRGDTAWGI